MNLFHLTFVYAANAHSDRVSLWNDICNIENIINGPWIVLGDFNCHLSHLDKKGGNLIPSNKFWDFNRCINQTHLKDFFSVDSVYI